MRYKIKEKYLVKLKNYLNEMVSNNNDKQRNKLYNKER
jgi:hypothetical protein